MQNIRILTPQDNRIPANSIGTKVSQSGDYLLVSIWPHLSPFKVLKTDTIRFTPLSTITYKSKTYRVIKYLEDFPAGLETYNQITGYRFEVKDNEDNHLILTLDDLD